MPPLICERCRGQILAEDRRVTVGQGAHAHCFHERCYHRATHINDDTEPVYVPFPITTGGGYSVSTPDPSPSFSGGGGEFGGGGASGGWDSPSTSSAPDFSNVDSGSSSTSGDSNI